MSIREEILQEHSKEQSTRIAKQVCNSKALFKELMQCFLGNEKTVAQRASWIVSIAAKMNPEIIKPYIKDLVSMMQRKDVHNALIRNSVRVLGKMDIPEPFHGEVMNTCFQFIEDPKTLPAIKAFSITILHNLSKQYPEILHELKLIIHERWDTETAAFKSRGRKIIK